MATTDKPTPSERIACEICLKEVPASEATIAEATDYFVHFCGLECYEKWKSRAPGDKSEGAPPKQSG